MVLANSITAVRMTETYFFFHGYGSQVNAATSIEELQYLASNEVLGNALITAGWLKPLTLLNSSHAMQTLIVHNVLVKRKEPLDQFRKGLESLGNLDLIKSQPDLMDSYFQNTLWVALTSQQVIECLHFQVEDKDKEAKTFLIRAIQDLENGWCGDDYLSHDINQVCVNMNDAGSAVTASL